MSPAEPMRRPAKRDAARRSGKPGQGARHRRLARARFAHDAQDLAAPDVDARHWRVRGPAARPEQALALVADAMFVGAQQFLVAAAWSVDQPTLRPRHGGDQAARIVVRRRAEDRSAGASSTIAPCSQDGDPIGDARDQREVVRDIERGDAGLRAQAAEQLEDARAGDDVERGRRLVEDDELGPAGEGGGDHRRAASRRPRPRADSGASAPRDRADRHAPSASIASPPRLPLREAAMADQHLGDLAADRQGRIERGRRDPGTPCSMRRPRIVSSALRRRGAEIGVAETDAPAGASRALPGRWRMIAQASEVLPEPDSPTRPSTSPAAIDSVDVLQHALRAAARDVVERVVARSARTGLIARPAGSARRAGRRPAG